MRFLVLLLALLAGCGHLPDKPDPPPRPAIAATQAADVVMYALGLLESGYRFGGKNPSAGIDCSGLVTYTYRNAANLQLVGNAATLARQGRPVDRSELQPGDLVFFNTRNKPFSHVGIYVGDDQFIHALNERSGVRLDRLSNRYYRTRYETARTLLN